MKNKVIKILKSEPVKIISFVFGAILFSYFPFLTLLLENLALCLIVGLIVLHAVIRNDIQNSEFRLYKQINEIEMDLSEIKDNLNQLDFKEEEKGERLFHELDWLKSDVSSLDSCVSELKDNLESLDRLAE